MSGAHKTRLANSLTACGRKQPAVRVVLMARLGLTPCAQRTEIAYSVAAADNRALNPSAVRWPHIFVIVR